LASVVVVTACCQLPDGSSLWSLMVLAESGAPLTVRAPERLKDWLTAGAVVEAVRESWVGVEYGVGVGLAVGSGRVAVGSGST